jgi:hypothetical protein
MCLERILQAGKSMVWDELATLLVTPKERNAETAC